MSESSRPDPWLAAGVLAPLLYAATVVVGGWLTVGYSHLDEPISALIRSGAPTKPLLDPLFAVYNLLLVAFAFRLRSAFAAAGAAVPLVVPAALALVGVLGLIMGPLPMDAIGSPPTPLGIAHIVLAGAQSLGTMVAILSLALALRGRPGWGGASTYSFVTVGVLLVTGGLAAWTVANAAPLAGLWERLTIGAFEQWVFVHAIVLMRRRPA